ncbi:AraC family transcriptional regulator [Paenibacillus macquariensis]|uniref:Transcriptional regulator, AraC family n=1 Tax=Paenibacillus macquariensis TaxID=948756 RepID=A0ABY1JR33_9BACL|nr:AraC family transcriptional regulator [Paenibacillus macquariensis]MEC0092682.1 AraC family transcriptional regulator [Paenibacillus macquariensis]OAB36618.1 hypothetical protein PMSM_06345 [Paenibacillus macquariensis subsp. macquariensis]SIQ63796.1 transcriptional regulator, AraC family [Paenibacillus macquariensis]
MEGKYKFEMIEHIKEAPMQCFIAGIEHSSPHWHNEFEVLFLLKGSLEVTSESKKHTMKTGDIILFNSNTIHSINCLDKDNFALVLQINPDIYQSDYGKTAHFHFHLNTSETEQPQTTDYKQLQSILAQIGMELFLKNDGFQYYMKSLLYQLVGYLFRYTHYDPAHKAESERSNLDLEQLTTIIEYINKNHQLKVTLNNAAYSLNMSISSLCRFFRDKMGISFAEYLHSVRISHAKELLTGTKHTVLHISEACGFMSMASFYRAFRKATGTTPTEYREIGEAGQKRSNLQIQGYSIVNPIVGYELLSNYIAKSNSKED